MANIFHPIVYSLIFSSEITTFLRTKASVFDLLLLQYLAFGIFSANKETVTTTYEPYSQRLPGHLTQSHIQAHVQILFNDFCERRTNRETYFLEFSFFHSPMNFLSCPIISDCPISDSLTGLSTYPYPLPQADLISPFLTDFINFPAQSLSQIYLHLTPFSFSEISLWVSFILGTSKSPFLFISPHTLPSVSN